MFMQVFIECRRRLHHEESYVKYFHENSSIDGVIADLVKLQKLLVTLLALGIG